VLLTLETFAGWTVFAAIVRAFPGRGIGGVGGAGPAGTCSPGLGTPGADSPECSHWVTSG